MQACAHHMIFACTGLYSQRELFRLPGTSATLNDGDQILSSPIERKGRGRGASASQKRRLGRPDTSTTPSKITRSDIS